MADVRVCVGSFVTASGLVTQSIPVSDASGTFTPKLVWFQGGAVTVPDAVRYQANSGSGWHYDYGAGTVTVGSAAGTGDLADLGVKATSGAIAGLYSVMDTAPSIFFGGGIQGYASITAVADGSFDITWALHLRAGQTVIFVAVGGDDLSVTINDPIANGVVSTTGAPQGLIDFGTGHLTATPSTATAAGGAPQVWGWAAKDSGQGALTSWAVLEGNNYSGLWTDRFAQATSDVGASVGGPVVVSAWDASSYTISGATSTLNWSQFAFCGDLVSCAAGTFTQRATVGDDVISPGLIPKLFLLASVGQTAGTIASSPCQSSIGYSDTVNQFSYWAGESTVGVSGPITGARYLGTSEIARLGTANSGSTTFNSVGSISGVDPDTGDVTITWDSVTGTEPAFIWFVIGESAVPPPPPPTPVFRTREVVRRRLRRAPIVWNEKGGLQTRVRINLFAVDMQPGVGTADTPDPLVMIRASKDGGFTWGNERRLTAGRVGEFFNRINAWQWGQGRDWVFEVSCTDPVLWNLVGAYFDAEGGDN